MNLSVFFVFSASVPPFSSLVLYSTLSSPDTIETLPPVTRVGPEIFIAGYTLFHTPWTWLRDVQEPRTVNGQTSVVRADKRLESVVKGDNSG